MLYARSTQDANLGGCFFYEVIIELIIAISKDTDKDLLWHSYCATPTMVNQHHRSQQSTQLDMRNKNTKRCTLYFISSVLQVLQILTCVQIPPDFGKKETDSIRGRWPLVSINWYDSAYVCFCVTHYVSKILLTSKNSATATSKRFSLLLLKSLLEKSWKNSNNLIVS